ncbi:MAG: patatin-like phospholipase family protein [Hahellaceae bacterium]|nr:patatin-like phospholipase family protein [Hahellaceae bacterium]
MGVQLLAGETAYKEIREAGLRPQRIRLMVGASGGPKWLMLSRLDQYLARQLLTPQSTQTLTLLGSSVGAWRMACYARSDAAAAFREFETIYLDQRYSRPIRPEAISDYLNKVLNHLFPAEEARHIVLNSQRCLNIVAVRNRRYLNGRSRLAQGVPLLTAAVGNVISPEVVKVLYPRVVIGPSQGESPYAKTHEHIELTEENLHQALIASGAIPMVMAPARIQGGKDRWYWDGGVVDYHFSGPFNVSDGLVFYPHFSPRLIPGWFDKGLAWRRIRPEHYHNVVLLTPTQDFIDRLPYGKIPDRKDFETLPDSERERYWRTVLDATNHLVENLG